MKKFHFIAVAVAAIMLAACAGKSGETNADNDSTQTAQPQYQFYTSHDINGARVYVPKGWKIDRKNEKGVHLNKAHKPYKDATLDIISYGSGSSEAFVAEAAKAVSSTYQAADDITLGQLTYKHFVKQLDDSLHRHDLWADYSDGQGFLIVTLNGYEPEDPDIQAIFNEMMIAQ